jgi:cytoskeleton protein RodZ
MSENGKPVFEEAAAERELDGLRQAIEEARARRRRANAAFDEFLEGFAGARSAAAVPAPPAPPPRPQEARAEPPPVPRDAGLSAFSSGPEPAAAIPVIAPATVDLSSLDDFAQEGPVTPGSPPVRSIPAALAPVRTSPLRRAAPLIGIVAVGVLAVFLWSRGGALEESAPPEAAVVSSAPPAPGQTAPSAAVSATQTPPPAAEVATSRRVWMRVTVDGQRVVEREVPEGTRIPLTGSQIVIRAGDAGAVRVSIAGQDQGALGPAGQVATRTFSVKP